MQGPLVPGREHSAAQFTSPRELRRLLLVMLWQGDTRGHGRTVLMLALVLDALLLLVYQSVIVLVVVQRRMIHSRVLLIALPVLVLFLATSSPTTTTAWIRDYPQRIN